MTVRNVYVAAPWSHRDRAEAFAQCLGAHGVNVASSWHMGADPESDLADFEVCEALLEQNMMDLAGSDIIAILLSPGGGRETYVELGRMLALGRRAVIVACDERGAPIPRRLLPLSWCDPLVTVCADEASALSRIVAMTEGAES